MKYLKRINLEYLFLVLWIILLPLMLNRYVRSGSFFERMQASDFIFIFLVLTVMIKYFKARIKFNFTYLWPALLILAVSLLASSLNSGSLLVSFSESAIMIYLIFICLFIPNIIRDKGILSFCLNGWLFASLITALLGITGMIFAFSGINSYFVKFYPDFLSKAYRLISTMSLPNMAYSYLHVGFFLSLGLFVNEAHRAKKIFYFFAICILTVAIFFTYSRGWYSFLLGLGIFLYFYKKKRGLKLIAKAVFLAAFIVFVFVQLFITYTTDLNFSFKSGYDDNYKVDYLGVAKNRLFKQDLFFEPGSPYRRIDASAIFLPGEYWYKKKAAVKLWQQHPLFGIGPGMFTSGIKELSNSKTIFILKGVGSSDPHSTYFGSLAEGGLFGFLALFILLFYFLKKSADTFKKAQVPYFRNLILCCISSFAGLLSFGVDVDIMNFRWVWFLMGLTIAIGRISELPAPAKTLT